MTSQPGVFDLAAAVLRAAAPDEKVAAARALRATWDSGCAPLNPQTPPPDRPGRPSAPDLVAPYRVKRRRLGTPARRAALLHAVAHIEFNAIDLAADMIARFAGSPLLMKTAQPSYRSFMTMKSAMSPPDVNGTRPFASETAKTRPKHSTTRSAHTFKAC